MVSQRKREGKEPQLFDDEENGVLNFRSLPIIGWRSLGSLGQNFADKIYTDAISPHDAEASRGRYPMFGQPSSWNRETRFKY